MMTYQTKGIVLLLKFLDKIDIFHSTELFSKSSGFGTKQEKLEVFGKDLILKPIESG